MLEVTPELNPRGEQDLAGTGNFSAKAQMKKRKEIL